MDGTGKEDSRFDGEGTSLHLARECTRHGYLEVTLPKLQPILRAQARAVKEFNIIYARAAPGEDCGHEATFSGAIIRGAHLSVSTSRGCARVRVLPNCRAC